MSLKKNKIVASFPIILGIFVFFFIVGLNVLDPKNIAWLSEGDPATHYLGWLFFRNSPWTFPLGLNPNYGLEIANSIVFSDSIPLLALIFKLFKSLLSIPFQYFGIWLLACFIFQAWFGWKLAGLISDSVAICVLSAGLFVFSPPMISRLNGHISLVGHFLILAALYLALHPKLKRRYLAWGGLLVVAALVHAYFLAIVVFLWIANLFGITLNNELLKKKNIIELLVLVLMIVITCWQAGYFSVGSGLGENGFGYYRMNLLSVIDASGWSYVLKDIPEGGGDYEGFNFLGSGVIFLVICAIPTVINGSAGLAKAIRRFPILLVVMTGLTLFAVSNKVGVASFTYEWPLPKFFTINIGMFRASGRMFWPVFYALYFIVIFVTVRSNTKRTAIFLLGFGLVIQVADTSVAWIGFQKKFSMKSKSTWATPLVDPFWKVAASRYKNVRLIQPENSSPKWSILASYAGTYGLATDAVYLARVGILALKQAKRKASEALKTGKYEGDSFYILDNNGFHQATLSINHDTDVLAHIDGFNVLAPGWKKCINCPHLVHEVQLINRFHPLIIGERVSFTQTGTGVAYLSGGWYSPEARGTWSEGETAEIIIPVSHKVRQIFIDASALVTASYPNQSIVIKINGVPVFTAILTKPSANIIEIHIPSSIQNKIVELGLMKVQFQFANAVRPIDIGFNEDSRKLALRLQSITLY